MGEGLASGEGLSSGDGVAASLGVALGDGFPGEKDEAALGSGVVPATGTLDAPVAQPERMSSTGKIASARFLISTTTR